MITPLHPLLKKRVFERPLRRSLGYHLLTPGDREPPLRVRAFRAWLRSELAA